MITAKLNDGFTVELNDDFLDDSELLERVTTDSNEVANTFMLRDKMLTPENKTHLYDHLRNEKGIVPMSALSAALMELVRNSQAGKNSASSPN